MSKNLGMEVGQPETSISGMDLSPGRGIVKPETMGDGPANGRASRSMDPASDMAAKAGKSGEKVKTSKNR